MLIETSCAIGISGRVKAATLGIRHGQGRLEIKLAIGQPFNSEHGTGANRTARMGCCVSKKKADGSPMLRPISHIRLPGLFKKSAMTIARTLAPNRVSPKGPGSGLRMLTYFM